MTAESRRPTREETRDAIIDAAIAVVGRHGYAKASMARIAEEAGIAYGSIYLHFENQRDLFLHLLPRTSRDLRREIRERATGLREFMAIETAGFDALCELAVLHPARRRVFVEAPFFVPEAYDAYLERMAATYLTTMRACKARGDLPGVEEPDFEPLAYSLMGAKQFLVAKYIDPVQRPEGMPPAIRASYLKFVAQTIAAPAADGSARGAA